MDINSETVENWMYRVPGETMSLIVTVILVIFVGIWLSSFSLYLVIGMVFLGLIYIRLRQAQYLGDAIRIHSSQFPEIWELFKTFATRLGIERASLYIKQDPNINAFTIGFSTCTVVLTSALVEQLSEEELRFVIGHELGHFKAGHTKISTMINPLGTGNIFADFIFGFWSRKTEYSSDRCGLILTKNIDAAITGFIKLAIGGVLFKRFDLKGYFAQLAKSEGGDVRLGELLTDHPLITNRIKYLLKFWTENFKNKYEM